MPEVENAPLSEVQEESALQVSLLDQIIQEGRLARDDNQKGWARDILGEFVKQVMEGAVTVSKDTELMINARIAQIDALISQQLNEIMHHDEFQRLEASWRGLRYLVDQSETGEMLKIRVMNIAKKDLLKDMEKASEFDQSTLFKKIYEDEFGTFGGSSYGALIGDYEFGAGPQDVALLEKVSEVAAAAHAPFVSAASPSMFNWDSFSELSGPRDLSKIFQSVDYAKWKSFRDSEDSRYVALALPHILMRLPYGRANVPVESFDFEENVDGTDHGKYLWGNAAWALGSKLTDAFSKYRWCAAIRGVEGGGLVQGLPVHTFKTDEGDVALKCPTEIAITDRREKELADLGFIPLVHCKNTDYAAFFSTQTVNKAQVYATDDASSNAKLSSQLQYIMAVSRFAHYLKAMMRAKVGSFLTRKGAEDYLNRWISKFVLLDQNAGQEMKAQYPLSEARVDVTEIPGQPGSYRAIAFLKPHYQLDELAVSLRLVANLPAQGS
ncbi:type VI secretion system contractile sheath large subunit [Geomonas sp. RF6]|uniref:type VI secretion system contractile sheath large subunit n=1 Tax=Geomonas sp. RF6 TaxID=2897342 RepID=UPI001E51AFA9|nr:type VI secretion system contractile sheath large subunit [Geomonas sp. RF6]UFS70717.1 type VI secretion system contractile sheath large subunit [Geomonas sp. RF6]